MALLLAELRRDKWSSSCTCGTALILASGTWGGQVTLVSTVVWCILGPVGGRCCSRVTVSLLEEAVGLNFFTLSDERGF